MNAHFCTNCGTPLAPTDQVCASCGHPAPAPPAASSPPASPPGYPPPAEDPFAGDPEPPAPVAPAGRDRRGLLWLGVIAVLALIAGAVWMLFLRKDDAASAEVLLEPVGVEVPDPFTASASVDETAYTTTTTAAGTTTSGTATTAPTTTAPTTGAAGGAVVGSAPGLYGGTRQKGSCDPERLISFLQGDKAKAAAWAAVQRIDVSDIPSFVRSLTPVVLRRDTRVLNHGYRNGKATPRTAVLQAGTAVLVDSFGVPRAKCACGNPLAEAPALTSGTRYTGTRWNGFTPAKVVVVRVDVKVSVFVLVDLVTGQPFSRPVGTSGSSDAEAGAVVTTTTTTTAPDGGLTGTAAPKLAEIASIAGVSNGPTAPSVLELPAARITAITTYHWNNATGDPPGTIGLRAADGTMYGPFPATGSPGQGGVPNANWTAITDVRIPAGSYTVVDSNPATWAWAPDTGGRGMTAVYGIAEQVPKTTTTTQAPSQGPDRAQEAIDAVQQAFCADPGVEDWRQYITQTRATETDFELYRVEVRIELDSGGWTALFDVDFATEGGPEIRAVNSESQALLC